MQQEVEPVAPVSAGPDPWDRRSWLWLLLVISLAAPTLLYGLEGGTLRIYDEGLHGQLARNALEHGQYLHAVGRDGELYGGFTKPPLTIACVAASFRGLGVSLLALRLPFALSMLGLVAVAFAWGRRIAGLPFAVAWAGCMLGTAASFRWGRVACIEPMLMLWILLGLWAYHEALVREGARAWGWAAVAGVALALAVLTKQVVVGIAVVPIVGVELWRREGWRALGRLALVLGLPALTGAVWLGLMVSRFGDAALELYLHTGVVRRVVGFETGHSARSLNELSQTVAEACMPFPWVIGVAGLVVLVLARPPGRRSADGALLLPLLLLTAVVAYENASQSLLPWYAFDFVPPLTAGVGFLIAGLVRPGSDGLERLRAVGGALALAVGAVGMLAPVMSQLDVAVIVGIGAVVLVRAAREPTERNRTIVRFGRHALLVAAAVAFAVGTWRNPELRSPPGGHEQLMRTLAARGIVDVDVDLDTRLAGEYALGTYYGPHAQWVSRPPWRRKEPAQAYVTGTIWPLELRPENGSEVLRGPGVMALVGGDLGRPAWNGATIDALLDAGPITFEAEHLPSERPDAVVEDREASGGTARARVPFRGRREEPFLLAHGPRITLPAGRYTAEFQLRWDCDGTVGGLPAAILHLVAGPKSLDKIEVACEGEGTGEYRSVPVELRLERSAVVELRVQYVSGAVWLDRTVVRRHG
jgi:4-amino-4-deoxy-L-arabinose transferase-like glycosyltransferase